MSTVQYGRTFNLGNYENERIHFEDQVQPGETPEAAFERVKGWVQDRHRAGQRRAELAHHLNELESHIERATSKLRSAYAEHEKGVQRYNELRALLAQHGVELKDLDTWLKLRPIEEVLRDIERSSGITEDDDDDDDDDGAEDRSF